LGRFEENIAEFRTRECPNNLGRARPRNSLTHKSKEEKNMYDSIKTLPLVACKYRNIFETNKLNGDYKQSRFD
jgi:hypothetical protein